MARDRYGFEFVEQTYLYHLIRRDNRHNFSVYFYHLYLRYDSGAAAVAAAGAAASQLSSSFVSLAAFLPQVRSSIAPGALNFGCLLQILLCFVVIPLQFWRDLPFCLLLQTLVFVAFNKVCTAQVACARLSCM